MKKKYYKEPHTLKDYHYNQFWWVFSLTFLILVVFFIATHSGNFFLRQQGTEKVNDYNKR